MDTTVNIPVDAPGDILVVMLVNIPVDMLVVMLVVMLVGPRHAAACPARPHTLVLRPLPPHRPHMPVPEGLPLVNRVLEAVLPSAARCAAGRAVT